MSLITERLWNYFKGPQPSPDAVAQVEPENAGRGLMHNFRLGGSEYHNFINAQYNLSQKAEKLSEYREMEYYPETCFAIDLITNTCVTENMDDKTVTLEIVSDKFKDAKNGKLQQILQEEWDNFFYNVYGGDYALEENFRRWFVDGQLWLETVRSKEGNGFSVIKRLPSETMLFELDKKGNIEKYFQIAGANQRIHYGMVNGAYNPTFDSSDGITTFKKEEITYIDSSIYGQGGYHDPRSRLEAALRTFRQLKLIEDALVIYRLVRAPEKRIFNVDVGTMPKGDAEQYIKKLIESHRSKNFYDPVRGEISRKYNPMSLNEDFWIPSRGGQSTTRIENLQGASNLGNITDVEYFLQKIYRALHVPDYLIQDKQANVGDRAESIRTQDVIFARYCEKLQKQFSLHLLRLFINHLKYSNIDSEFDEIDHRDIRLELTAPSYYKEYREIDIENKKSMLATTMLQSGLYPKAYILKKVYDMDDGAIKKMLEDTEYEPQFQQFGLDSMLQMRMQQGGQNR